MYDDCQNFCKQQTKDSQQPVIVTDPDCTRVFHPDGSVEIY